MSRNIIKGNRAYKNAVFWFCLFIVFTILVMKVDVEAIGPRGSSVGFATVNGKIRDIVGQNEFCYKLSEYLGNTAILVCVINGIRGAVQLFKNMSLKKVDPVIIILGITYIICIMFYVMFSKVAVNYRPILESDGSLESSYPSSHTMLAVVVFATEFIQDKLQKDRSEKMKKWDDVFTVLIPAIMIISRLLSGAHWFTDIIGSIFLSFAIVSLFKGAITPYCE